MGGSLWLRQCRGVACATDSPCSADPSAAQACDSPAAPTVGKCDKCILKMMGFWYSSRNCFSFTHWAVPCPSEAVVLSQPLPFGGAWQCWQQDEPIKSWELWPWQHLVNPKCCCSHESLGRNIGSSCKCWNTSPFQKLWLYCTGRFCSCSIVHLLLLLRTSIHTHT